MSWRARGPARHRCRALLCLVAHQYVLYHDRPKPLTYVKRVGSFAFTAARLRKTAVTR